MRENEYEGIGNLDFLGEVDAGAASGEINHSAFDQIPTAVNGYAHPRVDDAPLFAPVLAVPSRLFAGQCHS